ncbi:hypothetical protein FVEG_09994 [Fusarium verticillioides 7600]|uniref:Uncharacterized protein n=1 Tax=Gibberella moniliformis (strain M3125 / FGSC 7600) TaxID=334819 RepID=W7MGR1_GIBM7|nr:hypothetical protein FVEG_09994 [Fusarium verticillioides 7600]EWG50868.1 hypothetical protein FVEG_09994 [Fusarium verticillioides 7600]
MGLGLPNDFAEKFHPNEKGHVTMASFAMAEAMDLRSLVLGIDPPSCEVKDQFKCWSDDNWKIYASADRLDKHYEDFCKNIEQPDHEKGWDYYKVYDEDTPGEHEFRISLSDDVADYDVNHSYTIEGGGFSTWDFGQKTMRPSMNGCYGLGTTAWNFEYYDEPTEEGYKWKLTFNTPVFVRSRFFKNNKVVKGAGGWTEGCGGND